LIKKTKSKKKLTRTSRGKSSSRSGTKPGAGLKNTVSRRAARPSVLQYVPWNSVLLEDLTPLLQRQFVVGQEIMLARVLLKKGCIVPEHSHHNEQITYILEGALRFTLNGDEVVTVNAGEMLVIPSNVKHSAEALVDTIDLDVFAPPREDWIQGTDAYLRK
jgi:quercetin dioxygenase-like cupin family protein